jgi:hypothetical protein
MFATNCPLSITLVRATLKHHLDWDEFHLQQLDWSDWTVFYEEGLSPMEAAFEEVAERMGVG